MSTLAAIGLLTTAAFAIFIIDFLSPFFRPSQITRFLHTAPAGPSTSNPHLQLHPWALITGTTSGIGLALSHELASLGFNIVLHGRNPSKLEEVQKSLSAKFPSREFRTLIVDATSAPTSPDIFRDVVARLSDIHLTVLINNAGGVVLDPLSSGTSPSTGPYIPLSELSHGAILNTISLNLTFPVILTSALLPILSHRNNGPALVITVGSFADNGFPLVQVYGGAKAGLWKTMEGLSRELNLPPPPPSLSASATMGEPERRKGKEITIHHMRIGQVTGVSHDNSPPNPFHPDARTAARAMIARVGCGRTVIEPHWSMRVQGLFSDWAPWWVKDRVFGKAAVGLRNEILLKGRK